MAEPIDARIAAVARRQYGSVTRSQLLGLGLGVDAIRYRLRAGRLFRVYPGVYAVGKPAFTVLERAHAAVLSGGPRSRLGMFSGLALWGFAKRWPAVPEILTPNNRRPKGIVAHRCTTLTPRNCTVQLGIPVTTPARTILDCAPRLDDLTRTVDDALHTPYLTLGQLREICALHPTHRGTRLILPFLSRRDGPSRSNWEVRFPAQCVKAGLPRPLTNHVVLGRERDAWFAAERLIVELDSWDSHSGRKAFEDDRERDAEMLDHDIETVRITWERDTGTPAREFARLGRILARRRARFDR